MKRTKKVAILLISVLAVSTVFMTIAPVLAKPNIVSVTFKNSVTGEPYSGIWVMVAYNLGQPGVSWSAAVTDSRGKVNLDISNNNWDSTTQLKFYFQSGPDWITKPEWTVTLSKQNSARLSFSYP